MRPPKGINHEQRYYLCLKKQECPSMKQSELASWFEFQYSFPISQPSISHSLKKSAEILARGPCPVGVESTRVRSRPVRHPELELVIYEWVQAQQLEQQQRWQQQQKQQQRQQQQQQQGQKRKRRIEDHRHDHSTLGDGDGAEVLSSLGSTRAFKPLTGAAVIQQAKEIAHEMHIEDTVLCPGWLTRFKSRYNITFVNLDEIPPQSRGAITIASNNDDNDDQDINTSVGPDTSVSSSSSSSSGNTTSVVADPSLISILEMTWSSFGAHSSIMIPSSSQGAYSLLPDAVKTINLANIPLEQNDYSNDNDFEHLVPTAPLTSTERYPPYQQHHNHHHHHGHEPHAQDYTSDSMPQDQHSMLQQQHHQSTSRHYNIPQSTPEPNMDNDPPEPGHHFHSSSSTSSPSGEQGSSISNLSESNHSLLSLQGPQDVQRVLGQLRQYASSRLQDSSRALSSLDNLELELVAGSNDHRAEFLSWQHGP